METPALPMREVLDTLTVVLMDKATRYPMPVCIDFLKEIKAVRWYAVESETALQDIWNMVRSHAWVTDFVMDMTVDLQIFLSVNQTVDFKQLSKTIGAAIDNLHTDGKATIADDEFLELSPKDGMAVFFENNPWLVTCFLLSRLDVKPAVAIMQSANPAKKE